MDDPNLTRLLALIKDQRAQLLDKWRQQVRQLPAAANLDLPTINDQVPELLDRLADALNSKDERQETNAISAEHGLLRWQAGFDVIEVVAEYNILRQCLQEAAERDGIILSGKPLLIINNLFDDAISKAVKAFETMMTIELQHRHDEHLTFLLHDLKLLWRRCRWRQLCLNARFLMSKGTQESIPRFPFCEATLSDYRSKCATSYQRLLDSVNHFSPNSSC